MSRFAPLLTALLLSVACGAVGAAAAEPQSVELIIKDHHFIPTSLEVPAGQKITLVVKNQDPTPEEFESKDLKREKVVPGGKEIKLLIGPLTPGEYRFFGEYNEKTAHGVLIAR